MRALNRDLLQLRRRTGGDGSHARRRDRSYALAQMANALHEAGYRRLRAKGLKASTSRHWCAPAAALGCALEPGGRAADRPPARALT